MRVMFDQRTLVLDGAMGTQLQQMVAERGLKLNLLGSDAPEQVNVTYPEIVQEVHRRYLAAGSDIVLTNTFGANPVRLKRFGLDACVAELNRVAVANARIAGARWVAGSIGPTGEMSDPMGRYTFEDYYPALYPQVAALLDAGVDAIALETMMDLTELQAAVTAVRDQSREIPLIAQVYLSDGKMLHGPDLPTVAVMLEAMGVDVIGMNCVSLSEQLVEFLQATAAVTTRPLIVQPNGGMPDAAGHYHIDLERWRRVFRQIVRIPRVRMVGGCCGTNPEVIRLLRQLVDEVNGSLPYDQG